MKKFEIKSDLQKEKRVMQQECLKGIGLNFPSLK